MRAVIKLSMLGHNSNWCWVALKCFEESFSGADMFIELFIKHVFSMI